MTVAYSLTPELRRKLKEPLGILIRGSFNETMKLLKDMTAKEKPPSIISVGDTVSRNLDQNQLNPLLSIIDNKVMRKTAKPISLTAEETVYVKNPQGTITAEAVTAIQEATKKPHRVKIVVEGEEDLLALIAILHAPENSLVVYGQPREGIVVVKATKSKKAEVAEILEAMKNCSKS